MTGAPTTSHEAWTRVLDQLEARLADGGDFAPPPDLPPLPAGLAPRATALLASQARLAAELGERRDAVAAELAGLRAAGRRATRPGAGGDGALRTDTRI